MGAPLPLSPIPPEPIGFPPELDDVPPVPELEDPPGVPELDEARAAPELDEEPPVPELDATPPSPTMRIWLPLDDCGRLGFDCDALEFCDASLPQPAIADPSAIATAQTSTRRTRTFGKNRGTGLDLSSMSISSGAASLGAFSGYWVQPRKTSIFLRLPPSDCRRTATRAQMCRRGHPRCPKAKIFNLTQSPPSVEIFDPRSTTVEVAPDQ
jgi:hypothetical protein